VGNKSSAPGGFLVQSGKFLVVQNSFILNFCQNFEFWRHVFEYWCQNCKSCVLEGYGGGMGGSPRTSGRFWHQCRKKKFRPLLDENHQVSAEVPEDSRVVRVRRVWFPTSDHHYCNTRDGISIRHFIAYLSDGILLQV